MALRIALFGQAPLALECLDRLQADGHDIVAVYAPEDGSRPDQLAAHARELGLQVFQRRYFQKKSGDAIASALAEYESLGVDLNVLASFTYFLPTEMTDAPAHKSICYHPSLLPRYRGGNALQWQIIDGEPEVGVSIFVPDAGVDEGPLVVQRGGVQIDAGDTTGSLFFDKLAPLGVEAIMESVSLIDKGEDAPRQQDNSLATFQGLVQEEDAAVDFADSATVIDRLVRGCDPQPGAFVKHGEQIVRLYGAALESAADGDPGTISSVDDEGMVIALKGGSLRVGRVRADGGKESASDFLERAGLGVGDSLRAGR